MPGKLKITATPHGEVKVDVVEFQGPSCEAFSKPFQDKLGETTSDEKKPEFYLADNCQTRKEVA